MPRSSERGHPRTARRLRSPSRRGVTGSQPHARNSVASLRLTRLPEPRSVIRLLFLLRYHRPAKSPPSSLGKQTLPRSRLSRVCSTLCRVVHPLLRIVAPRGSPSTPQRVDPFIDPAHHPLRPTRTRTSAFASLRPDTGSAHAVRETPTRRRGVADHTRQKAPRAIWLRVQSQRTLCRTSAS